MKRYSKTVATKHVTTTTIFKYMPSSNSHITLYTHRNPYSTPGTNISIVGSSRTHTDTDTDTDTHRHTHTQSAHAHTFAANQDI